MLPFGVTIPATVPQASEIPEGLMNNPVYIYIYIERERERERGYIYIFIAKERQDNIKTVL
jgi:hypothetical protein